MSVTKQLIEEVNKAFETSDYSYLESHSTDDVRWTIGGRTQVRGKKDFIQMCKDAPFEDVKFLITSILIDGDQAAVESIMHAKMKDGKAYQQYVCDVYHFVGDKFDELRSYFDTAYDKEMMKEESIAA
jgi:ketosteroid isomerase-like protein